MDQGITWRDRIHSHYEKVESGCWLWTAYVERKSGYGDYGYSNTQPQRRAHRMMYECMVGPIPDGMTIDHLCHTNDLACPGGPACLHRRCVNPDHLELVTRSENGKRGHARRRAMTPNCPHGHPFDEVNTYITPQGSRKCKVCMRRRVAEHYQRQKALRLEGLVESVNTQGANDS